MTDIVERLRVAAPLPTGLYCEAADVIDALRQQLFEEHEAHLIAEQGWIKELNASKANDMFAMKLLAESQAREKVLLDAIENHAGNYKLTKAEVEKISAALAQPTDDTALKAALAAERERCWHAVKNARAGVHPMDAIRALGDK